MAAAAPPPMAAAWQGFTRDVQRQVGELWGIAPHSRYWSMPQPYMPHANPRSIMTADLPRLAEPGAYTVAPKCDGDRRFFIAGSLTSGQEYAACISRAFEVTRLSLPLSCSDSHVYADAQLGQCDPFDGTLLDGELLPDGRYVVHDAVAVAGRCVLTLPHSRRVSAAHGVLPLMQTLMGGAGRVSIKAWLPVQRVAEVLSAPQHSDGLIFTPENAPLEHGKRQPLFKWKLPGAHTIDFVAAADNRLLFTDGGRDVDALAAGFSLAEPLLPASLPPRPCLLEFSSDAHGVLRLVKVRTDKNTPNDATVVWATLENIRQGITQADIVRVCTTPVVCGHIK